MSFQILSFGDIFYLLMSGQSFINHLEEESYRSFILIVSIVIICLIVLIGGGIYLIVKTLKLKINSTGLDALVGKEAEVIKIIEDLKQSKGWVMIDGENWKFSSENRLKVGDTVQILGYKKMTLKVRKFEEDL